MDSFLSYHPLTHSFFITCGLIPFLTPVDSFLSYHPFRIIHGLVPSLHCVCYKLEAAGDQVTFQ